jgi:hypothetical protein
MFMRHLIDVVQFNLPGERCFTRQQGNTELYFVMRIHKIKPITRIRLKVQ